MSRSNVSMGCAKCFIIFMATLILVEGIVYLGLAIVGRIHRDCTSNVYDIINDPFMFALDVVYFIDQKCGDLDVEYETNLYNLTVDWTKSEFITNRLDIFFYVYIVISCLWIITSLFIICTLCCRITNMILGICFWPWLLVVLAGSAMDVVATGFHIYDITQTLTFEDTFNYVGISTDTEVSNQLQKNDGLFVLPSVIMTCISSRIVIIWILNILGSIFAVVLSIELSKLQSQRRDGDRLSNTSTVTPTAPQRIDNMALAMGKQKEPDQFRPQHQSLGSPPESGAANRASNNEQQRISNASTTPIVVYATVSPSSQRNGDSNEQSQTGPAYESITYRHTDTHPDHLNYPSSAQTPTPGVESVISPISPLNQRYSTNDNPFFANIQHHPSNRVSDELRSQLPWSYTSALNKPQPIRKPPVAIYPEIPEPDYAIPQVKSTQSATHNDQQGYSKF